MLTNTEYFIEVPKTGYTKAPHKSAEYYQWWDEQARRCIFGFTVGDTTITGAHYYHLNFKSMTVMDKMNRIVQGSPYFTDLDYDFFHTIDRCENEKKGFCGLKARRKGFSHKGATLVERKFLFFRNSVSIIGAYSDEFSSEGTMSFVKDNLNLLKSQGCAFAKSMFPDRKDYIRAAYLDKDTGNVNGYMSEIYSLTYGTKANAAAGKMIRNGYMIFEEAGEFKNLLEAYGKTEPCWRFGTEYSGIPLVWGTGGDMDEGCDEFVEMFYNPDKYNMMAFDNTYSEENPDMRVGYFCPATKFYFPFLDKDGNSDEEAARVHILAEREAKKNSDDPQALFDHCVAYPLSPEEGFLVTHVSPFNKTKLMSQIVAINRKSIQSRLRRGNLEWVNKDARKVKFVDDPFGKMIIAEEPVKTDNTKAYISGVDPYAQDKTTGVSKGAMFVYKRFIDAEQSYNLPVAQYYDRPKTEDEFLDNCMKLACWYRCKIMFEAQNKGWFKWFKDNRCIDILAMEPKALLRTIIQKHTSTFSYGIPMTEAIKADLVLKLKDYIEKYCENIFFIDLLKDLLKWKEVGNYDLAMAFGITLMFGDSIHKDTVIEDLTYDNSFPAKWIIRGDGSFIRM